MPPSSSGQLNARLTSLPHVVQRESLGGNQRSPNDGEVLTSRDVSRMSSLALAGSPARTVRARPHEQTVNVDDDDGLVDVLATTTFNDASGADMGHFG